MLQQALKSALGASAQLDGGAAAPDIPDRLSLALRESPACSTNTTIALASTTLASVLARSTNVPRGTLRTGRRRCCARGASTKVCAGGRGSHPHRRYRNQRIQARCIPASSSESTRSETGYAVRRQALYRSHRACLSQSVVGVLEPRSINDPHHVAVVAFSRCSPIDRDVSAGIRLPAHGVCERRRYASHPCHHGRSVPANRPETGSSTFDATRLRLPPRVA